MREVTMRGKESKLCVRVYIYTRIDLFKKRKREEVKKKKSFIVI